MRSTKAQVTKAAARLGAEVSIDESSCATIIVDAPRGSRFSASGTHLIVAHAYPGDRPDAWGDLFDRLGYGVEPCPRGGDDECRCAGCPAWAGPIED